MHGCAGQGGRQPFAVDKKWAGGVVHKVDQLGAEETVKTVEKLRASSSTRLKSGVNENGGKWRAHGGSRQKSEVNEKERVVGAGIFLLTPRFNEGSGRGHGSGNRFNGFIGAPNQTIKFDESFVFILESFNPMMFGLSGNVGADAIQVRLRYRKSAVTSPPRKPSIDEVLLVDPMGRSAFE